VNRTGSFKSISLTERMPSHSLPTLKSSEWFQKNEAWKWNTGDLDETKSEKNGEEIMTKTAKLRYLGPLRFNNSHPADSLYFLAVQM